MKHLRPTIEDFVGTGAFKGMLWLFVIVMTLLVGLIVVLGIEIWRSNIRCVETTECPPGFSVAASNFQCICIDGPTIKATPKKKE